MNTISAILASLLFATTPLASGFFSSSPKTESVQFDFELGETAVAKIRKAYEKGEYNSFLQEKQQEYTKALAANELDGLIDVRTNSPTVDVKKWEEKASKLQKLKNKELLNALSDNDSSAFAKKVRSSAAILSTPEQEKAVAELDSLLYKAPQSGKNSDENVLIDLDLEYEYKLYRAETSEQRFALRMEKMDKMVAASKQFTDTALKQSVALASTNFDARLAQSIDSKDLSDLAKGIVKAENPTEEKIASIYAAYQANFSDLFKEIAEAK